MITTKPLKATCVDGDRHRRHGDACLARDRRGRALCVLCAEAKFRDSDDAPTTTERLALCSALADVAADASSQNDAMLREATLDLIARACGRRATSDVCVEALLDAAARLDGLDAAQRAESLAMSDEAWRRGRGRRLVAALCRTARRGAFWHGPGALGCLNEAVVDDNARAARECCVALEGVLRDDPPAAQTLLAVWAQTARVETRVGALWARAAERARDDDREAARLRGDLNPEVERPQSGHFKAVCTVLARLANAATPAPGMRQDRAATEAFFALASDERWLRATKRGLAGASRDAKAAAVLVAKLGRLDASIAAALVTCGGGVVEHCYDALRSDDDDVSTKAAKALASLAKGAPRDFYRGLGAHHFDQLLEACRAPDQAPDRERALLDLVAGAVPEQAKLAPRALDASARVVLVRPARRGWAREQIVRCPAPARGGLDADAARHASTLIAAVRRSAGDIGVEAAVLDLGNAALARADPGAAGAAGSNAAALRDAHGAWILRDGAPAEADAGRLLFVVLAARFPGASEQFLERSVRFAAARLGGLGSGPYPLRCLAAWALAAIAQSDEHAVAEPLRLRLLEIAV